MPTFSVFCPHSATDKPDRRIGIALGERFFLTEEHVSLPDPTNVLPGVVDDALES